MSTRSSVASAFKMRVEESKRERPTSRGTCETTLSLKPDKALVRDLERRGLLEETLVVETTEFGWTPAVNKIKPGHDHHPHAIATCRRIGNEFKHKGISLPPEIISFLSLQVGCLPSVREQWRARSSAIPDEVVYSQQTDSAKLQRLLS